jgi:hypothetical protein
MYEQIIGTGCGYSRALNEDKKNAKAVAQKIDTALMPQLALFFLRSRADKN